MLGGSSEDRQQECYGQRRGSPREALSRHLWPRLDFPTAVAISVEASARDKADWRQWYQRSPLDVLQHTIHNGCTIRSLGVIKSHVILADIGSLFAYFVAAFAIVNSLSPGSSAATQGIAWFFGHGAAFFNVGVTHEPATHQQFTTARSLILHCGPDFSRRARPRASRPKHTCRLQA